LFGRETEFATLQDSYHRSISDQHDNELAIVTGISGTGKTVLASRLSRYITSSGGIFVSGKFDQLQQAKPFSAIGSAFNEYCDILLKKYDQDCINEVVAKLRTVLGADTHHLVQVIPNLRHILGNDSSGTGSDRECVNSEKRIQHLLCQFVDIIASSSDAAITLFLDDLQWADKSSLAVIYSLLLASGSMSNTRRFFFLGCCREEDMSDEHPFLCMILRVQQFGVRLTTVKLECWDQQQINTMISDLLHLSPRLTRTLSDIVYHKTKGNSLFFAQLMMSLSRDGLLRLSLSRHRWVWDEQLIQSRKVPDDVASFFTASLKHMSTEVQSALCALSCFGASCEVEVIVKLESQLQLELLGPLEIAVTEGLLDKMNCRYSFCHDMLQEGKWLPSVQMLW
jgi:predicted ATPase